MQNSSAQRLLNIESKSCSNSLTTLAVNGGLGDDRSSVLRLPQSGVPNAAIVKVTMLTTGTK